MQCPSCHHGMAMFHEDRHIRYYKCKHDTCAASGVQCKHCNLIKLSIKGGFKNIKFLMSKHYNQEHIQLQYVSSILPSSMSASLVSSFPSNIPLSSLACNIPGCNITTNNSGLISVNNSATVCTSSISTISDSYQSQVASSTAPSVDTVQMNELHSKFNYFDNHQSQTYFFLEMLYPPHGGARGIAWSAIMRSANNCYNVSNLDETRFLFNNYKLIQSYSSKHRGNLMEILKSTVKVSNVNNSVIPRFPIHDKDIYKIFMGGKHSIQVNLPAPATFNIADTACISLDRYIDHVLAHGVPITFAHDSLTGPNLDGLHGSEQCRSVVNSILASSPDPANTSVIAGYLWSDGFLGSNVRQRNSSVWAMTVTLSLITEFATSKHHTGVLALGWSKNDHQPVFDHIMNEVSQLRTPKLRYCRVTNSFRWISFGLCFYLADRPERDARLNLLGHGGVTSKRFGHVAIYKNTILPSCNLCYKSRIRHCQTGQAMRQCNSCTGWDIYDHPKASTYCPQLPGYPTTRNSSIEPPQNRTCNEQYLVPHKSSFDWLSRGVNMAELEVRLGNWSKRHCEAYLRSMGLNKSISEIVYSTARQNAVRARNDIKCPIPTSWQTETTVDMFIEAPMHLLFLGIVKSIMEVSEKYMKDDKLSRKFINHTNGYIGQLESLRVDYLQIRSLPNTNYLSEWCLGIARVFPFLYGKLTTVLAPSIMHGDKYMCMVQSMYVMIAHLMSRRRTSTDKLTQLVKLFLDCCHRFCKASHDNTITPFWLSKGNYVTLLNLPEQIERFGPLRDYWEGTKERYIHLIKRTLLNMRKAQSYMASKLIEVHRSNVLDWIMMKFEDVPQSTNPKRECLFHTYASKEAIIHEFNAGRIVSGYYHNDYPRHVIVAFRQAEKMLGLVALRADIGVDEEQESGMYFCKFTEDVGLAAVRYKEHIHCNVKIGAMMLPLTKSNQDFRMQYSVIYSDWDVLRANGDKNLPEISYDFLDT